jgi:hypothetical protein
VRGQHHAPAALYPREKPGTHCTGGWVGHRASLDRCGKYFPPRFDPRTVQPVASRYPHHPTRPTLPFDPRTVQPVASRYPAHLCTHTPPKYLHGEESENLPSFYGTQNSEHVRKIALMCPILMQTNPFRTLATCFDKILNFNIIPPSVPTSSK